MFKFLTAEADRHDDKLMLEPDFPSDLVYEVIYVSVALIKDNTHVQVGFRCCISTRP